MDEGEYREFGMHYDLRVIAAGKQAEPDGFTMFHVHGTAPMFDLTITYPVEILNWHDRRTAPDLAGGQRQFGRAVAGGLNEATIASVGAEVAAGEATQALAALDGRHVLIAPGCVVPVATPAATVAAVVAAVRNHG
jgi:uroporphyrinogen decarboxylase